MKKLLYLLPFIFVSSTFASVFINGQCYDLVWNPWTGSNQYVNCNSSSSLAAGSTNYIQNTLTPNTTTQHFTVQIGSVTDYFFSQKRLDAKAGDAGGYLGQGVVNDFFGTGLLTGTNTQFTKDFVPGSVVYLDDATSFYPVISIADDTHMTISQASFVTNSAYHYYPPAIYVRGNDVSPAVIIQATGDGGTGNDENLIWTNSNGYKVGGLGSQAVSNGYSYGTFQLMGYRTQSSFISDFEMLDRDIGGADKRVGYIQSNSAYLGRAGYGLDFGLLLDDNSLSNVLSLSGANGGSLGIGTITSPTARLHIPNSSGAAGSGPLKIDAGALIDPPEAGLFETDAGGDLYYTPSSLRYKFAFLNSTQTWTAAQDFSSATLNGINLSTLTLSSLLASTNTWTGAQNFSSATVNGINVSTLSLSNLLASTNTWTGAQNFSSATLNTVSLSTLTLAIVRTSTGSFTAAQNFSSITINNIQVSTYTANWMFATTNTWTAGQVFSTGTFKGKLWVNNADSGASPRSSTDALLVKGTSSSGQLAWLYSSGSAQPYIGIEANDGSYALFGNRTGGVGFVQTSAVGGKFRFEKNGGSLAEGDFGTGSFSNLSANGMVYAVTGGTLTTNSSLTFNGSTVSAPVFNSTTPYMTNGANVGLSFSTYTPIGAYTLSTTTNTIVVGTSSMTVTLTSSGTYSCTSGENLFYNAATFVGNQFVTQELYRQNNTPGVIANTLIQPETQISVAALTNTIGQFQTRPVQYTTTNTNDILSLQISIDGTPGAGSVQAKEAFIYCIRDY